MHIKGLLRGAFFYPAMRFLKILLIFLPLFTVEVGIHAEQIELSAFFPEFRYAQTERENMRVYIDNRYRGLQYRQRRVYLEQEKPGDYQADNIRSDLFRGSVYMVKNLTRDGSRVLQPVDRQIAVKCLFTAQGLAAPDRTVLPLRTGFPVLPREEVAIGDSWKADGTDSISIDDAEERISTPFHCTYTYSGEDVVMERPAQLIGFEYGYFDRNPYKNDNYELRGLGEGQIYIFLDERGGYFINERLIRHFLDAAGRATRREEGFRLTWGRGITRAEVDSLSQKLVQVLREDGGEGDSGGSITGGEAGSGSGESVPGDSGGDVSGGGGAAAGASGGDAAGEDRIEIEETVEGIKLSLPEIHFYPDEARILPSEKDRLDRLAELLMTVSESDFLIKGHTADVGTKDSQYVLSVERAKTILREMETRGLKSDRFIYQGLGGDEPLSSNDTEEGRAKNRRVEVIILNK